MTRLQAALAEKDILDVKHTYIHVKVMEISKTIPDNVEAAWVTGLPEVIVMATVCTEDDYCPTINGKT